MSRKQLQGPQYMDSSAVNEAFYHIDRAATLLFRDRLSPEEYQDMLKAVTKLQQVLSYRQEQ